MYRALARDIDLNKYLLFCEMILNLTYELRGYTTYKARDEIILALVDTIKATIAKAGLEIKNVNDEWMIVESNAVAIEVADKRPELSQIIIEYNHYLLKGNLDRKRELLKALSDALEPKKKELTNLNIRQTDDFFYLVNNMNIRHNNCDPEDKAKYNHKFTIMDISEREEWYDLIYEQGLALFIILDQQDRNKRIKDFRQG